jgi:hypothetical protein
MKIRGGKLAKNLQYFAIWGDILRKFIRLFSIFFTICRFNNKSTYLKIFQPFGFFIESDSIELRAIFLARHCRIKYDLTINLIPHLYKANVNDPCT